VPRLPCAPTARAGLLAQGSDFTALFAFNDGSAIGAMKAFQEAGLRVPLAA